MAAMSCARPCHQVKADREPPEGLGFDACARSPTLAKGLSVKGFLACKADERRPTCASPDGGKSGEWVGAAADTRPRFTGYHGVTPASSSTRKGIEPSSLMCLRIAFSKRP